MKKNAPIGVMDSGVGGFTVARTVQRMLPQEDIVYYGDGWNVPYGNRSEADILHLVRQILDMLAQRNVKLVAIACNTISVLIDQYKDDYSYPIFSVVQAGADDVISRNPAKVGVFSTMFTAKTEAYAKVIHKTAPHIQVIAQGSENLAALVDAGLDNREGIKAELRRSLGLMAAAHPDMDTLVLGCTHFPLVQDLIEELYPQFTNIIDPAVMQTKQIQAYLAEHDGLNPDGGRLDMFTSGDCAQYESLAIRLGMKLSQSVQHLPAPTPLAE